jgi:UDP-N-acetylmuramate dehydrogenase
MPVTVRENASLRRLNTFGVEQRAARLVEVTDPADLAGAAAMLRGSAPRLVLGGGSNVLFTRDFEGTVLLLRTRGLRVLGEAADATVVEAEAGESWDGFVRWSLSTGLGGLENLSLIPGSVGASPIQNIGAYGVEMRELFESLDAIDLDTGAARRFGPDQCAFGYRDSTFKRPGAARWLVARVRFRLPRRWTPRLDYGEIRDELARLDAAPSPASVAQAVSAIRRRKLPDPAVLGNAGSFFKNPVVEPAFALELQARHPGLPGWPTETGTKLSAAWMIERCGWKGRRDGDAGVHHAHALVLVNHGGATGAQILALAERVRASVAERFGVAIEPEPTIL